MEVVYKLDDINLKDYGVFISASEGLLSRPKPKKKITVEWPDYNGEVVDLSKITYEPRDIELDCFIKATSQSDFVQKCNAFLALFDKTGTRRLEVYVYCETTPKPLIYEVYSDSGIEIVKKWKSAGMVGTFKLKLTEPEPIKKIFKFTRKNDATKTVSITLTSSKLLNIYWGDGLHTFDCSGTNQTYIHNYGKNGTFYVVITGNIDEITSITSNSVIVWNKI